MIAHVPVAVSAAKRAQRITVGHWQSLPFSANDHAGLGASGAACTLTVTLVVVAAEVVVIVSWRKSRKPWGVAAMALALAGRRANGHPASVGVAELIALSCALSRQSHVWQLSGIWTRRREREKYNLRYENTPLFIQHWGHVLNNSSKQCKDNNTIKLNDY